MMVVNVTCLNLADTGGPIALAVAFVEILVVWTGSVSLVLR
jgi:hypothetical protein